MSWLKLHRQLAAAEIWLSEPFTRGQAWVDLLMLANHKDGWFRKRGIRVDVERGQVGYSELALADRWKWSRGKVRRFLKELEKAEMLVQQKNRVTTLLTIVNYDTYQQDSTTDGTTNGQQTDINKKGKKEKNIDIIGEYPELDVPEFRKAWAEKEAHRKEKRVRKLGPVAMRKQFAEFCEWGVDVAIEGINESIAKNWQGVFRPKERTPAGRPQQQGGGESTWEINTKLTAIKERLRQLKSLAPGEHCDLYSFMTEEQRHEWADLCRKKKELERKLLQ